MKRLLAGWLSLVLLFFGSMVFAEDAGRPDNATIEESFITVEGEDMGSLAENILLLKKLTENEDVAALLKNEEVSTLASEITLRVLRWMVQNRPVTMKILAELGFGEEDLHCVEKIWDSADRVRAAYAAYQESEDGKQLQAEWEAVENDPEIRQSVADFQELFNSEDLQGILKALMKAVEAEKTEHGILDGTMAPSDLDGRITENTFIGRLIIEMGHVLEHSAWAQESLPKMIRNENLARYLIHLSSGSPELDSLIREECTLTLEDPEVSRFLQRMLAGMQELTEALSETAGVTEEKPEGQPVTDAEGQMNNGEEEKHE